MSAIAKIQTQISHFGTILNQGYLSSALKIYREVKFIFLTLRNNYGEWSFPNHIKLEEVMMLYVND